MSVAERFIKRVAPALSSIIGVIRTGTSYLGPKDDWIEGLRKRAALKLHPYLAPLGRPLVTECFEEDYVATADATSDEVEVALHSLYQRNETSTRKFRTIEGDRDWAVGSWVFDPNETEYQHHVYLFDNPDGTCDVYGHYEKSAEKDPYGHVTEPQEHGDPNGTAREQLDKSSVTYETA